MTTGNVEQLRQRSLVDRVEELEDAIFGTREGGYRDGLKPQLWSLQRRLNYWGAAIMAALIATGLVNGDAAKVLGGFLKGLAGG